MGTRVDISVVSDDPQRAARAISETEQAMLKWSKDWYPWGTTPGELKQLNLALASAQSFRVSNELRDLLLQARQLSITSEGYFDPAIAPMIQAWGFDDMNRTQTGLPEMARLDRWAHDHPTMQDVIIDNDTVSSKRQDMQLDLGAIAKGYAVDLSLRKLASQDISAAVMNIGGQIGVLGNADKQTRVVQIRDPRSDMYIASLTLKSAENISTSGDYERYAFVNGKRYHHLLDPHTGKPVDETQMITVIASSGTLADAASTAIMAAGRNWRHVAEQMSISQVLRVDATGEIQTTAAMYARLHWNKVAVQNRQLLQVN